jgi:hypothetical protein
MLTAALTVSLTIIVALSGWTLELSDPVLSATEDLLRHAKYLSSAELTGRGVDTPGIKLARDYIAAEFVKYGLRAAGDANSYLQSFEVTVGVTVKEPSSLALGNGSSLRLNDDWTPLGLSASDKVAGEIVFAGYGITAKEYGYDDYAGIDVKGKIALVLRYEPPPKNDKSPFGKAPDYSTHAALRAKANNARDHGAIGLILVDADHSGDESAELLSTRGSLWRGGNGLVAVQIKRRIVEKWLGALGVSLKARKESIDRDEKPASIPLPRARAAIQVSLEEQRAQAENVVAMIPGSDPTLRDEYVVVGAHYDHLGYGHFGARNLSAAGQIHHGADDNASGTAVTLYLASRLSRLQPRAARSIVFVAFSGEELGLHGSRYFVNHWPQLSATKAMINLDMVGRLKNDRVTVFGMRTAASLGDIVSTHALPLGLQINQADGVGPSDHVSFYSKKIPVLHFFTGTHGDYHRPSDTWEKLNIEGMAKISDLVMASVLAIANSKERLNFVSLPSRPPGGDPGAGRGFNVYLGVVPDYGADADGVLLAGVAPGSPAAAAGFQEGDVIVQVSDKKIHNIEDLTDMLRARKAGDRVDIVVRRKDQSITLSTTLRSRS